MLKVTALLLFILSLLLVQTVYAQSEQFGISLECYSCINADVDYSKDILLVLTIRNNLNQWVSLGDSTSSSGASLRIDFQNSNLQNGRDTVLYQNFFGNRFLIKPKYEEKFYIPFDLYNKLSKDDRLGDWKLAPELSFFDFNFYEDPFKSKAVSLAVNNQPFTLKSPLKGNILEFKSVKPEVQVQVPKTGPQIPKGFWDNPLNKFLVFPIIVLVVGGLLVWLIQRAFSRRR